MKKITFILCLVALFATTAKAATIFVALDATGANNGSSWANAYTDLQTAINAAANGDQIWVKGANTASGMIYRPSIRTYFYPPSANNNVAIYGGFNGSEMDASERNQWSTYKSVLTIRANSGAPYLFLLNGANITLDGFYIRSNTTSFSTLVLGGNAQQLLSNLIIQNNSIANPIYSSASLIYTEAGDYNSRVKFYNVVVSHNSPNLPIIHNYNAFMELYNVTIAHNNLASTSIPIFKNQGSECHIYNSIIWNNSTVFESNSSNVSISYSDVKESDIAGWWSFNGVTDGGANMATDPQFTNSSAIYLLANLRPKSTSPVIDAGDEMLYLTQAISDIPDFWIYDVSAEYRIYGSSIDMGAYEVVLPMMAPATSQELLAKTKPIQKNDADVTLTSHRETVSVFPSKVTSSTTFYVETNLDGCTLKLYSTNGICLMSTPVSAGSTSVFAPSASGIYLITVLSPDGRSVHQGKIMVTP